MNPTAVLHELRELKEAWSKQSFKFTNEQEKRYSELIAVSYTHLTLPTKA